MFGAMTKALVHVYAAILTNQKLIDSETGLIILIWIHVVLILMASTGCCRGILRRMSVHLQLRKDLLSSHHCQPDIHNVLWNRIKQISFCQLIVLVCGN